MPDAIFLGEAMLELSQNGESWTLGYGGDTLNTAVHLARAGIDIGYFTAMGVVSTAEQKSAIRRRKTRPSCYMPGGVA